MTRENHADKNVNKACLFRDNLYRLTLTSLTDLEHASWSAPEDKVNTCQNKGQSVEDCRNYVKVLLSNGKSLFTCGTYAFSPWCAWREVRSRRKSVRSNSGEIRNWVPMPLPRCESSQLVWRIDEQIIVVISCVTPGSERWRGHVARTGW